MAEPGNDLAAGIQSKGYAVIPGFFSAEEIAHLRAIAQQHFDAGRGLVLNLGIVQPNAAIEIPGMTWLYGQEKVVALFRRALNSDDIVFTGHCDVHQDNRSDWHKDSGPISAPYFSGDFFAAADCRVYKMAVYLQDHVGEAGGLSVVPCSHHASRVDGEGGRALDTRAGDVILFDVRLTHSGQRRSFGEAFVSLVNRLSARGAGRIWRLHERYLRALGRRKRFSVFFTFGCANRFTEDFSSRNMARQRRQTGNTDHHLPPDLAACLAQRGVRLASVLTD